MTRRNRVLSRFNNSALAFMSAFVLIAVVFFPLCSIVVVGGVIADEQRLEERCIIHRVQGNVVSVKCIPSVANVGGRHRVYSIVTIETDSKEHEYLLEASYNCDVGDTFDIDNYFYNDELISTQLVYDKLNSVWCDCCYDTKANVIDKIKEDKIG